MIYKERRGKGKRRREKGQKKRKKGKIFVISIMLFLNSLSLSAIHVVMGSRARLGGEQQSKVDSTAQHSPALSDTLGGSCQG